ncbi:hypothetical protein Tco_1325579, partial [Tanacetum coccineum]
DSDDEEEHVEDEYVHDENNVHDDVEKKHDVNVEMKDAKIVEESKVDEEMADKPDVPPLSSSLSISSDYGTQFLNLSSDFSLIGITKESADTEINSIKDLSITTTIHDPLPVVIQRLSNLKTKFEACIKVDHSEVIAEVVQTNVINEVENQLPKLLPKVVSDFVISSIESKVHDMFQEFTINPEQHDSHKDVSGIQKIKLEHATKQQLPKHFAKSFDQAAKVEYDQKDILFKMMRDSKSYKKHPTH